MTTSVDDGRAEIVAALRRDPLRNVVLLKFARHGEGAVLRRIADGDQSATMLILDHEASAYDRAAYPAARASLFLASDAPGLTRQLLGSLFRDAALVLKLDSDADRAVAAESFSLDRRTAYHSFCSGGLVSSVTGDPVGTRLDDGLAAIFRAQGHDPGWLRAAIDSGTALTAAIEEEGEVVSACFAFAIDAAIWEIGGVFTRQEFRGRGLARRAVLAMLAVLQRRGITARYQANEDNLASLRLAEAIGLRRHLTLTHYLARPHTDG